MTPPVKDRLFIRQPCSVRTDGAAALEIPLKLDAPGEALVWVKMRCFNQANVVRFKVLLDGQPLREPYQFPTYFITPHHPGPATDVWFWSCIANTFQTSEEGKRPLMGIPAGQHVLSLVPDTEFNSRYGKIDVEFGETIVTNDLGYVPPGITNYLIDPARGRR
jgi:hypothetical protein